MVVQHSGCWEASWVLGKWLGLELETVLGLVVDLRLLVLSSQETVATAAVAGKSSGLEGSPAGPRRRNCNVHEL